MFCRYSSLPDRSKILTCSPIAFLIMIWLDTTEQSISLFLNSLIVVGSPSFLNRKYSLSAISEVEAVIMLSFWDKYFPLAKVRIAAFSPLSNSDRQLQRCHKRRNNQRRKNMAGLLPNLYTHRRWWHTPQYNRTSKNRRPNSDRTSWREKSIEHRSEFDNVERWDIDVRFLKSQLACIALAI